MANTLDKFYNVYAGLDTRSNKLLQPPGSFRRGSKNFRYDFQDQITQANGFQHKDSSAHTFVDIFEYKYRNVDTGAAETQILGVSTAGNLYRKINSTLSFTAHGAATSVSIYYDEVADTFKCDLAGLGSVNISDTMTLAQLETALELLTGVTITISGDSSVKAYLLDCVIADTSFADNVAYYWEIVPFPDSTSVPFVTTKDYNTSSDYEGISSVNLNNVIYITDGGFPMKYDGKAVYRAGVPATRQIKEGVVLSSISGIGIGAVGTANTPLTSGSYSYKVQFGFRDFNGASYFGEMGPYAGTVGIIGTPISEAVEVSNLGYNYGKDFAVFGCKVSSYNAGTKTITVSGAHNVQAGMCLVQYCWNNALADKTAENISHIFYAKVDSVTTTTIVLQNVDTTYSTFNNPAANQHFNAYWVPSSKENKIDTSATQGEAPYGAFLRVFRTKVDQNVSGPWYFVQDCPLPLTATVPGASIIDNKPDFSLTINMDDLESGYELPRACKYLSSWQSQLVQAGRPVNWSYKDSYYPSLPAAPPSGWPYYDEVRYTEALLCDFQSVYWADSLTPEGFPQSGLNEFSIDTKFSDKVTGIGPNKDALFAFKERSTAVLSGDLGTNDIVMEVLEADCGCISHKTIEEVRGSLVWLDGINGFFACVAGRLPENIGFPIQDYTKINTGKLNYRTASAANFRKESLYVCSVGTTTFVYDYADNGTLKRGCWYLWDRIDGKSVLATSENELLIWDGTKTWKMKLTNSKYDFTDHKTAIPFVINTSWATQGHPTVDKHYVNLWINSIQGDFTLTVKQYGNFLEDQVASQSNVAFIAESSAKKAIKEPVKAYLPKLSAISFGMENAEKNKWVRIQGYEIQYSPDYATGEPKR